MTSGIPSTNLQSARWAIYACEPMIAFTPLCKLQLHHANGKRALFRSSGAPGGLAGGKTSSARLSGSGAAAGAGAPATGSSAVLDVPGHSEATLRLHKARIRGLEDEMSKLTQALAGEVRLWTSIPATKYVYFMCHVGPRN